MGQQGCNYSRASREECSLDVSSCWKSPGLGGSWLLPVLKAGSSPASVLASVVMWPLWLCLLPSSDEEAHDYMGIT